MTVASTSLLKVVDVPFRKCVAMGQMPQIDSGPVPSPSLTMYYAPPPCGPSSICYANGESPPNFYSAFSTRGCQGSLFLMCARPRLCMTWPGATHSLQELTFNEHPHSPSSARFVSSSALLAGRLVQLRKMIESSGIEMPVAYSSTAMAPCLVQRRWGISASWCPYLHLLKIERSFLTGFHI